LKINQCKSQTAFNEIQEETNIITRIFCRITIEISPYDLICRDLEIKYLLANRTFMSSFFRIAPAYVCLFRAQARAAFMGFVLGGERKT